MKDWCVVLVRGLVLGLSANGFDCDVLWDDDGEPEVFANWTGGGAAHGRLILGDDRELRYGFVSIGAQGAGCVQVDIEPNRFGMQDALRDFIAFRRVVDAIQKEAVTEGKP